jgi:hypothetical protein
MAYESFGGPLDVLTSRWESIQGRCGRSKWFKTLVLVFATYEENGTTWRRAYPSVLLEIDELELEDRNSSGRCESITAVPQQYEPRVGATHRARTGFSRRLGAECSYKP